MVWPSTESLYAEGELGFDHDRHTFDDEFLDLNHHRHEPELHRDRRYDSEEQDRFRHEYDFDSDAEEQRWYSKYEGGDYHDPLEEHHDVGVYERRPLESFEFEYDTVAHPYHEEVLPYHYGQYHGVE